jgi:small subunit ribosomal protein S5
MAMQREWKSRTSLGKAVQSGEITSLEQVFEKGIKIREGSIVDALLPGLKSEIILFGGSPGKGGGIKHTSTRRTSRMHSSGRRFKISALVAVGAPGYLGLGKSTANEHAVAINKATEAAKVAIMPIRRGCGAWDCACGEAHSLPIKIAGKSGSVVANLIPAPKGIGLAIGDEGKKLVRLAGVNDIWCKILGQTRTRYNYVWAIFDAFKKLNALRGELPEAKKSAEEMALPALPAVSAKEAEGAKELLNELEAKEGEAADKEESEKPESEKA